MIDSRLNILMSGAGLFLFGLMVGKWGLALLMRGIPNPDKAFMLVLLCVIMVLVVGLVLAWIMFLPDANLAPLASDLLWITSTRNLPFCAGVLAGYTWATRQQSEE
jgi:hypothetical protein